MRDILCLCDPRPRYIGGWWVRLIMLLLFLSPSRQASAQTVLPQILRNVGFDQRLNEQVPLDLPFTDDEGERVKLGKYFEDKPVILVLAYYRCPMLCTQVLNGLVQGLARNAVYDWERVPRRNGQLRPERDDRHGGREKEDLPP
jgi:cytochrome oxidase Cu insertion factor (SCO1/SenC/PrrC family)